MVKSNWPLVSCAPSWKVRSRMRPGTCGVTVTDSNAPFRPISSRYVGTSREMARVAVTSGATNGKPPAAAPWVLQAVVGPTPAISPRTATRRRATEAHTLTAKRSFMGQALYRYKKSHHSSRPAPHYCILLANIPNDFVEEKASCFERTGEGGQSLCGVPSGGSPSLKLGRVSSSLEHLV